MLIIKNCDLRTALHRQEIVTPKWLILCVTMHNAEFTATDVASKIWTFLKTNHLKYQVMAKLLDQVISKGFQVK